VRELNERRKCILRAITDVYIDTAEPVGSTTIARKHNLGISSATIRNEMASLEEEGYVYQPHTSAGRVPSDKGYRYYVDVLLEIPEVTSEEYKKINQLAEYRKEAIEKTIRRTTKLLAELTEYVSVAVIPEHRNATFRHIQLVPLDVHNILVILVVDPGFIENRVLSSSRAFSPEQLDEISAYLNQQLRGKRGEALTKTLLSELNNIVPEARGLISSITDIIQSVLTDAKDDVVVVDGLLNILDQPEFQDLDRTKLVLSVLENRKVLSKVLSSLSRSSGLTVQIGEENESPELKDFSLVTATYYHCGHNLGTIGLLGPTRMTYGRAMSLVKEVAMYLSELFDLL
jgi:heat-inducible transcriptional repressor